MVAEVLAGIALVSSAVKTIKASIDTAKDIREIAGSIDELMTGTEQCQKNVKVKLRSGQAGKWQNYLRLRFTSVKETGDGTSIQEVAAEIIEKKHAEREVWQMQLLINKKFGANTWNDIIIMRQQRIEELDKKKHRLRYLAREKAAKTAKMWKRIFKEGFNVLILVAIGCGAYALWYIAGRN